MSNRIGYCTNVHAGVTLDQVKNNLDNYALPVRDAVSGEGSLPIGLWLSKTATDELATTSEQAAFSDWLSARRLNPYTFNGFPFGDFHQAVVKHDVYLPTWADEARLQYTKQLADIQVALLQDDDCSATISTLPLGWSSKSIDDSFFRRCGQYLVELAVHLSEVRAKTGTSIRVCLEPEPGCVIDTAQDMVNFFERYLHSSDAEGAVREHLGVCHDVCHSAVMFEPQQTAVRLYQDTGVAIGKVQVSSAVEADFESVDNDGRAELLEMLSAFAEPRYLHQTLVQQTSETNFFEDLPVALSSVGSSPRGKWRVHFHVPIFQSTLGKLGTTQDDIASLVRSMKSQGLKPQWEIETYAWNVLPDELQNEPLAQSITREIDWFRTVCL